MFRRSAINWESLLCISTLELFNHYNISHGILALDDTSNNRSKRTKEIYKSHKTKDKATGGYVNAQELLFLVLITDKVTIPVGFKFYAPDPELTAWIKADKSLKKQGISKKSRGKKPLRDPSCPTKQETGLQLLQAFKKMHPGIKVQGILADALYGSCSFVCAAEKIYPGTQIVSQVKANQIIRVRGQRKSIREYFQKNVGVKKKLIVRGLLEKNVMMHGARVYLKAHRCKRFIIALKYDGEEEYRYLMGTDMTWRLTDIANLYTFRWLVEVFIGDWKSKEGWCQLAKHPGFEGSYRGVILSLMTDHCLLLHPNQKASIQCKLPAWSVGSLRAQEQANAVIHAIEEIIYSDDPEVFVKKLKQSLAQVIPLQPSSKHMNGRDLGRMEPTPSLVYHVRNAA